MNARRSSYLVYWSVSSDFDKLTPETTFHTEKMTTKSLTPQRLYADKDYTVERMVFEHLQSSAHIRERKRLWQLAALLR